MSIIVVPAEKNKFKVLVNYIQHGIAYSTRELADKHVNEIKNSIVNPF